MKCLIFYITFLSFLYYVLGDIRCYDCDNHSCDENNPYLARCGPGTKMCYVIMSGRTGIENYERGCLTPNGRKWTECMVKQSNKCFMCFGSACNHMEILYKSKLECIQCEGDSCKTAVTGERCTIPDTILGPAMCVSRYKDSGQAVDIKTCWNAIYKKEAGFNRELHFTCVGNMCNYQNEDALVRCLQFNKGTTDTEYKPKRVMCYKGGKPDRWSFFPGCYRDYRRGKFISAACNSRKHLDHIIGCKKSDMCQLCEGDMCNDTPGAPENLKYLNMCHGPNDTQTVCDYIESMCYAHNNTNGTVRMGCVSDSTPGLYNAEVLMCSNKKLGMFCAPKENINDYRGCYECTDPPCHDVLVSLGHLAKTICPLGTTQCYSARRADGMIFRGCYPLSISEGVKVCNDSIGACKICSHNYCNYERLMTEIKGQCYKSNWNRIDTHETSLRFADCTGTKFWSHMDDYCYIAVSSRLFFRMGCISELVGIDDSYSITTGSTRVAWLHQNTCYKCVSTEEGHCFEVHHLKGQHKCRGLNQFPTRGCYTLIDKRSKRLERGCITELNEYMLRLCNMPIFFEKCMICQDNGCNKEPFGGWE